jgi:hypothetical protein
MSNKKSEPTEFSSKALSITEKDGKYLLVETLYDAETMKSGGTVTVLATESSKMEIEEKFRVKAWDLFIAD